MASVSLAEPRRRQKWTLNPRGNLWANDESKFGQKLMEKMGWEKGRGLGANQDGMVDHITLKHKDNTKGVGFQGHDDTWLAHQDDFQNLLAALNVEHGDAGKNMDEDEKKATLSEISKKSKRRVHYQKFVKGKDSSNYSADDLGCILGTKSDKLKSKSEPSSPKAESEDETVEENDKNFVQRGSYTDYFASKMAALKAQGKFTDIPAWTEAKPNPRNLGLGADKANSKASDDNQKGEDTNVEKKKSKKKKREEERDEEVVTEEPVVKVKKKKSKKDRQEKDIEAVTAVEDSLDRDSEESAKKKKKSKKSKSKRKEEVLEVVEDIPAEVEVAKKKKTKKSKKEKVMEVEEVKSVEEDSGCENEESKSKKTKKGKKEKVKEKKPTYSDEEKENVKKNKRKCDSEENEMPRKKSKKTKEKPTDTNDTTLTENPPQIGFQGSNLLAIPGYGSNATK